MLSQMMLLLMQTNPMLVQSSDRHSTGELASRLENTKLDAPIHDFVYVPSDPRKVYHELLSRCLDWDLEVLKDLPEDEDVSLGILSPEHNTLLSECASRWRLPPNFRAWVFLEAVVERCEQGSVPAACVYEATATISKIEGEMPLDTWAKSDVGVVFRLWVVLIFRTARRPRGGISQAKHLPPVRGGNCSLR